MPGGTTSIVAGEPTLARHIVRYEQHVRHLPDALSGTDGVDGVAVQWFRSIDDFVGFISEPAYAELIAPELGWSSDEAGRQAQAYRASVARERESAHLPETALDASLGA